VGRLILWWCMKDSRTRSNILTRWCSTWFSLVAIYTPLWIIVCTNGEPPSSGKCFCITVWQSSWSFSHTWSMVWDLESLCCLFMTLLMCSFALVDWLLISRTILQCLNMSMLSGLSLLGFSWDFMHSRNVLWAQVFLISWSMICKKKSWGGHGIIIFFRGRLNAPILFMTLMASALVVLHSYWFVFILRIVVTMLRGKKNYNLYDKEAKDNKDVTSSEPSKE